MLPASVVRDRNRGAMSVTNDAEGVTAEVAGQYPGKRIVYLDSMDQWDELCHDGGRFLGFKPYGKRKEKHQW